MDPSGVDALIAALIEREGVRQSPADRGGPTCYE